MGEINLVQRQQHGVNPCDVILKKYLLLLSQKRQRAVILYASRWTQPGVQVPPDMLSITDEDLQGLMTVMNGVQEQSLDLILHSPGGSLEAAEGFVTYLRSKFPDVCVIVPQQAMSAATMIACSANNIVLGKHSFLGPTDPQFIFATELGQRVVTAQNVEEQFERARKECADPSRIGVWIPILKQYGPDLLQKCQNASALSQSLVAGWLEKYMFAGHEDGPKKAKEISAWLSSHKEFKTHGRHLSRDLLRSKKLEIIDLEADQEFQDLVLSIFHATTITFDNTPVVKIMRNHAGKTFAKMMRSSGQMMPQAMRHDMPPGFQPPPGFPPQPNQNAPRTVNPLMPGQVPNRPQPAAPNRPATARPAGPARPPAANQPAVESQPPAQSNPNSSPSTNAPSTLNAPETPSNAPSQNDPPAGAA